MINVKELTDIELNRAMIWLYFDHVDSFVEDLAGFNLSNYCDDTEALDDNGILYNIECQEWCYSVDFIDGYLSWDLTMPLAVENRLWLQPAQSCKGWFCYDSDDKYCSHLNKNPLRAICEALVQIKLEKM